MTIESALKTMSNSSRGGKMTVFIFLADLNQGLNEVRTHIIEKKSIIIP